MPEFRIVVHLHDLMPSGTPLGTDALVSLSKAVRDLAEEVHTRWVAYATEEPLPDGRVIHSRSGTYRDSIQIRELGEFAQEVYSDAPHASALEEGMPERDLKAWLSTSHKVRIGRKGARYLIIPFRWNTPGHGVTTANVMPRSVHRFWQAPQRARSHVVSEQTRPVGHRVADRSPLTVTERKYIWGHRLGANALESMGVGGKQARRLTGMVNLRNPGGSGGAAHSQYLTFRVMSDNSPASSWIAPRVPGFYPARTVAEQLRPRAEELFREAVAADIRRYLGGG